MYYSAVLFVLISAWSSISISAEYEDSDEFPVVKYIGSDSDTARFVSNHYNRSSVPISPLFFVYNRHNRKMMEVQKNFHEQFSAYSFYYLVENEPGLTSTGENYQTIKSGGCSEWIPEGSVLKIHINNKPIQLVKLKKCQSVDVLEIVNGNQLWLATVEHGGHGDYQSEGIIIQGLSSATMLAHITPISGVIKQMHVDPISKNVWVITENGVYEISPKFEILSTNLFYHDFNPSTGHPRFGFSEQAIAGNHFSRVSRFLPVNERKKFYETVIKIPKNDIKKFTLYDFFMCCNFSDEKYPITLQPLVPFFIKANKHDDKQSAIWRQSICRLGGPGTKQYCNLRR